MQALILLLGLFGASVAAMLGYNAIPAALFLTSFATVLVLQAYDRRQR